MCEPQEQNSQSQVFSLSLLRLVCRFATTLPSSSHGQVSPKTHRARNEHPQRAARQRRQRGARGSASASDERRERQAQRRLRRHFVDVLAAGPRGAREGELHHLCFFLCVFCGEASRRKGRRSPFERSKARRGDEVGDQRKRESRRRGREEGGEGHKEKTYRETSPASAAARATLCAAPSLAASR